MGQLLAENVENALVHVTKNLSRTYAEIEADLYEQEEEDEDEEEDDEEDVRSTFSNPDETRVRTASSCNHTPSSPSLSLLACAPPLVTLRSDYQGLSGRLGWKAHSVLAVQTARSWVRGRFAPLRAAYLSPVFSQASFA